MSSLPKHLLCRGFNGNRISWWAWTTYLLLAVTTSADLTHKTFEGVQGSRVLLDSGMPAARIKELDQLIQVNAFSSIGNSRTGEMYNVALPSNLTGVNASAIRLRTGSLRRRGLALKEFLVPPGAAVNITTVRVLLVYRQFNGINVYSPKGYMLVSPVLGIRVYDAFNLSSKTPMPELDLTATGAPITVRIPFLSMARVSVPLCAAFDSNGSVITTNVSSSPNVCSTFQLGDFALVVPASALAPAPQPALSPQSAASPAPLGFLPQPPSESPSFSAGGKHKGSNTWKIALGSTLGGIAFLSILALLAFLSLRYREKAKMARMEQEAEHGETLQTAVIRETRAPTAGSSRTRPTLETDYPQ
ncbi:hypothetical protein O6H91_18G061900 [Diphasiastrum complanatum]|uniref:Uncharacterized protein n=1 Tax=Diphasiastrum complanatum TaxID=34168 RepID=A0ACC2B210_DIPCM|nr:hypothetical protein O6H91_18G061900 [Diphasiastrum complanatum]